MRGSGQICSLVLLVLTLAFTVGCSDEPLNEDGGKTTDLRPGVDAAEGDEGGPCYPNDTCNADLILRQGDLPQAAARLGAARRQALRRPRAGQGHRGRAGRRLSTGPGQRRRRDQRPGRGLQAQAGQRQRRAARLPRRGQRQRRHRRQGGGRRRRPQDPTGGQRQRRLPRLHRQGQRQRRPGRQDRGHQRRRPAGLLPRQLRRKARRLPRRGPGQLRRGADLQRRLLHAGRPPGLLQGREQPRQQGHLRHGQRQEPRQHHLQPQEPPKPQRPQADPEAQEHRRATGTWRWRPRPSTPT